jgi:hydrogenase expression/formation protein HypE
MSPAARYAETHVTLAAGAGGRSMRRLVGELLQRGLAAVAIDGHGLAAMDDGAAIRVGDRYLVMTTDSHVVQPLFFPGGDIGRLAVAGTVNDLAMMGATEVLALALGVVLEEGFPIADLERIQESIRSTSVEAGAPIVTGDTKVLRRGELDGMVLHTTGVAFTERIVTDSGLRPGDRLIVTGTIGDHGFAILAARHELELEGELASDVRPIHGLVRAALAAGGADVVAMKDPTRGGLASALFEMAEKSGVGILLDERAVPVSAGVRAASELLGIDPLHVANEGKAVVGVRPAAAERVLAALRSHADGRDAAIVGTASAERPGAIVLDTGFGRRLLAELEGNPLPRIC